MVAFGGWDMPIQYSGILLEHEAVRTKCGVFDVSHMGEVDFEGPGALAALQRVTTNDAAKLAVMQAQYTLLCHPSGGIVDDCIVYRLGPTHYRVVVNAANIAKDLAYFAEHAPGGTLRNRSDELALLAVQGPESLAVLRRLGAALDDVPSFGVRAAQVAGQDVLAARTGYTGEDGFELFIPADRVVPVWEALLEAGTVPIGLGARDTLRLEARLPLYGNDLDDSTTPDEAGLSWVVNLDKGDFVGRDAIVRQRQGGPLRKLVGFRVVGRGIIRSGAEVLEDEQAVVGRVTSGGPAPTLGGAIGLAYVPTSMARPGETLSLRQRGKVLSADVVAGPFYRRARPNRSTPNAPGSST